MGDILVLGSSGMLGQALIKELKYRNKAHVGLARKDADIRVDVTDSDLLLKTVEDVAPEVIINTVAIVDLSFCEKNPVQSYLCNARVSGVLSNYCALTGKKYVYISTDHYFAGNKDQKHSEKDSVNLCNEYALTKYLGEKLALVDKTSLVARTNIVGFRGRANNSTFLEWAINSLKNKVPINLFDDFYTSSIDVKNFSRYLCDLIEKDAKGVINLASSEVSNKKEFIEAIAKRLNFSLQNTSVCSMKTSEDNIQRNESLGLDVSKAEKLLARSLPNLSEVIESLAIEFLTGK